VGIFSWFKKKKKDEKVRVTKQRSNALQETAAAVAFAEAGEYETARRLAGQAAERKILAIGSDARFSSILATYSIDMAKRLECELVALNVTDAPLSLPPGKQEAAIDSFRKASEKNVTVLREMAEKDGIPFKHQVEIGHPDEVISKLHAIHPGMRYVLIEPDPEVVKKTNGNVSVPVFDLSCYHHSAA